MPAYYNENDPFAAAWLRELITRDLIAPGVVDERSIEDVNPTELAGFSQCHFFAGIGGWSYALRLAGWSDERPVWTGSCPCQPFSEAGKQQGRNDARHLWPSWLRLIRERRPQVIFGEQVASDLIVGSLASEGEEVSSLRDREAVFGILRELERQQTKNVQGMSTACRETTQTLQSGFNISQTQAMEGRQTGPCSCECCQTSCENQGHFFRFGPHGNSAPDRRGTLRDDRNRFRSEHPASLECAFIGSSRQHKRLYEGQCSSGAVCAQRDGECLGAEPYLGDCIGYPNTQNECQLAIAEFSNRGPSASPSKCWLDEAACDLEGASYAVASAVLPSCAVGAPHKRDRLFFVADTGGPDAGRRYADRRREPVAQDLGQPWAYANWQGGQSGYGVLDDGLPADVAKRLANGFGNAIVPQVAAEFITAYGECRA